MEFVVQNRSGSGKSANRKLRAEKMVPGIVYGVKEPLLVQMPANKTMKLIQDTRGGHATLDLKVETEGGSAEMRKVIIQDFQQSNYKQQILHIDFREVDENSTLKISVPIQVVGTSKAVKLGGTLQIIRHEIPIRCKAKDIPEHIEVSVAELDFGDSIHVLDIPYPPGVKPIVSGRNFTLITLAGRMKEVEETEQSEEEEAATEEKEAEPSKS